jgi:FAD/FMN-containing dehydrogenase
MTLEIDLPFTTTDSSRLRAATGAVVATPDDEAYTEEVNTWNAAVRLRPAVVVGARTADDVVAAVRWAAELGLRIGVNATGHGAVPNADAALLVSTRRMSDVTVDPVARTASIAASARMRDVTAAAAAHGLAAVQGSSGSTGAVGFTLGGGLGVMSRTFGLAVDRVLAVDIVTVDGRLRRVDADHDPDLFWALRGGKGSFGVVTSLTIALHPMSTFYGGGLFFDGRDARIMLRTWRRWVDTHTDESSSSVALLRLPDEPQIPEPIRGRYVAHVRFAHAGDAAAGSRIADRMRATAPLLLDTLGTHPVTALDLVHLDPPGPLPARDRGGLLTGLGDSAVDAVLSVAGRADFPLPIVDIRRLGGEIARHRSSAVPGRDAAFSLTAIAIDAPPVAEVSARAQEALFDAVLPWRAAETFPNFIGRFTDPAEVARAWAPETRERLFAVKRAWDPDNLFSVGPALLPSH